MHYKAYHPKYAHLKVLPFNGYDPAADKKALEEERQMENATNTSITSFSEALNYFSPFTLLQGTGTKNGNYGQIKEEQARLAMTQTEGGKGDPQTTLRHPYYQRRADCAPAA